MDHHEDVILCACLLSIGIALKLKRKKKKLWVKTWISKYGRNGNYENVYREWRESDPDMFRTILRIYPEDFDELIKAVGPLIAKMDTQMRDAIPVDKRLAITLRYLSSGKFIPNTKIYKGNQHIALLGESFTSLSGQFCTGISTVRLIVKETCVAIAYSLRSFSQTPNTPEAWTVSILY